MIQINVTSIECSQKTNRICLKFKDFLFIKSYIYDAFN